MDKTRCIVLVQGALVKGAQWLSGSALESKSRGCGFEPHRCHYVVSLSKHINPCMVLVQLRKTRPDITEKNVNWGVKNQIKQQHRNSILGHEIGRASFLTEYNGLREQFPCPSPIYTKILHNTYYMTFSFCKGGTS